MVKFKPFTQNTNNWRLWIRKKKCIVYTNSHQQDIDKTCLHAKHSYESKYQFLINKRRNMGLKHCYISIIFIKYSGYAGFP